MYGSPIHGPQLLTEDHYRGRSFVMMYYSYFSDKAEAVVHS